MSEIGGIISFCVLFWFSIQIWMTKNGNDKKSTLPSPASWLMWMVLDSFMLVTTIIAGKPMWLPLSYTAGATFVTIALLVRSTWVWSYKETICAIGAGVSMYVWQKWGAGMGILAGCASMTIAGIPLILDMIRDPIRKTFYVYALVVLACTCTLLGSDWTLSGTALAWGGIAFNGTLALVVLRGK
ncbi:MAG: hypothetical protein WCW14_00915 [Candidatus Paceibacterota bacterium]